MLLGPISLVLRFIVRVSLLRDGSSLEIVFKTVVWEHAFKVPHTLRAPVTFTRFGLGFDLSVKVALAVL